MNGSRPPWAAGCDTADGTPHPVRAGVATALAAFSRTTADRADLRQAAVAVTVVLDQDDRPAFLLTRRAATLRAHAGQFALPGGRLDAGETPVDAARRELAEELGLDLPAGAALGLLDDYVTRSGYVMTPVVLWAGRLTADLVPGEAEVAQVFTVPFDELDVDPRFVTIPESDSPVVQLPLVGHHVHAPTAAVLYQFREVVLRGRPTRVAHLEAPVFAWR